MRNRQVCEANRKARLMQAAEDAFLLPAWKRNRKIDELRMSHDWLRSTRVTRGIINEYIARWMEEDDSVAVNANEGAGTGSV